MNLYLENLSRYFKKYLILINLNLERTLNPYFNRNESFRVAKIFQIIFILFQESNLFLSFHVDIEMYFK